MNPTDLQTRQIVKERLNLARTFVKKLPIDQQEACQELAEHIRATVKSAGMPVGAFAVALVNAELEFEPFKDL